MIGDPQTLTDAERERKHLTSVVDGAIRHRLKWASVHWHTEKVDGEAWSHITDAVVDALLTTPGVARPAATTDTAVQALRDVVWQQGANIGRYKAAHAALTRDLGLDFSKTGSVVGLILSDLRRGVSEDYERVVNAALDPGTRTAHHDDGSGS